MEKNNFVWFEKYRPTTLTDCILPKATMETATSFVSSGELPHLLLVGGAGTGKTTLARVMANELQIKDILFINASEENGIDVLRTKIRSFCSTMSFDGGKKMVILDEADHLTVNVQAALRGALEEFASNTIFVFTANYKSKIIDPLHSRLSEINFSIPSSDRDAILKGYIKRCVEILKIEEVKFDVMVLAKLVKKFFPDFRKILNELQRHSSSGELSIDSLNATSGELSSVVDFIKAKNFKEIRGFISTHPDVAMEHYVRYFYDKGQDYLQPMQLAEMIIILADYQYKHAFAVDKEVNIAAMMINLISLDWS
jgi:replication factor C small subunit